MSDRLELHEKLYFHEIESREQVNSRLQLPLTLIVALVGVFAYLFQSFDRAFVGAASYCFAALLALTAVALVASCYHFVRAAWGETYSFLPYARATEDYFHTLKAVYAKYDEKHGTTVAATTFTEYLQRYFIDAATANAKVNDLRSIHLHKASRNLIVTTALAAIAFLSFVLGDLDRASKQGPLQVLIARPVEVNGISIPEKFVLLPPASPNASDVATVRPQGTQMTKPDPPPPPPPPAPPPMRLIKEGVRVVVPPPAPKEPPK